MSREVPELPCPLVRDDYHRRLEARIVELEKAEAELKELKERLEYCEDELEDSFCQACQVDWDKEKDEAKFDHMCISAHETAQEYLIKHGIIKEEQCLRK